MQAASGTATVPVSTRGLAVAGAAAGFVRPRVVVPGQLASGEDCHEHHLVRPPGLDQSDSPPYRVERSEKPPLYVIRMPGGVRGGNRKGPPYSIVDRTSGGLMGPGFRRDSDHARFHDLGSATPVAN